MSRSVPLLLTILEEILLNFLLVEVLVIIEFEYCINPATLGRAIA
jgi:hypothetical protein